MAWVTLNHYEDSFRLSIEDTLILEDLFSIESDKPLLVEGTALLPKQLTT